MPTTTALEEILDSKSKIKKSEKVITGQCDSCDSKAAYEATKNGLRLSFCGHHVRHNAATLVDRGFAIYPDNYNLVSR